MGHAGVVVQLPTRRALSGIPVFWRKILWFPERSGINLLDKSAAKILKAWQVHSPPGEKSQGERLAAFPKDHKTKCTVSFSQRIGGWQKRIETV